MLILINEEVIDVGDPAETLRECGVADDRTPAIARMVALGQDAAFAARGIEHAHPGIRRVLASYFALTGQVNCALFVCPPNAVSPREVAVRLGDAPFTTLVHLYSVQQEGKLSASMVNHHVWRLAPSVVAA